MSYKEQFALKNSCVKSAAHILPRATVKQYRQLSLSRS